VRPRKINVQILCHRYDSTLQCFGTLCNQLQHFSSKLRSPYCPLGLPLVKMSLLALRTLSALWKLQPTPDLCSRPSTSLCSLPLLLTVLCLSFCVYSFQSLFVSLTPLSVVSRPCPVISCAPHTNSGCVLWLHTNSSHLWCLCTNSGHSW